MVQAAFFFLCLCLDHSAYTHDPHGSYCAGEVPTLKWELNERTIIVFSSCSANAEKKCGSANSSRNASLLLPGARSDGLQLKFDFIAELNIFFAKGTGSRVSLYTCQGSCQLASLRPLGLHRLIKMQVNMRLLQSGHSTYAGSLHIRTTFWTSEQTWSSPSAFS